MGQIIGFFAIALMVVVLIVAVGSLFLVGLLPIARVIERRRRRHPG